MLSLQKLDIVVHNRPKMDNALLKAIELLDVCDS